MEPGREKHNVSKRRGQASVCIPVHLSRVNNVWAFFPCAWAWPFQRVRVETTTESILTLGSKVRQMTNASCFSKWAQIAASESDAWYKQMCFQIGKQNSHFEVFKCPSKDRAHVQLLGPWARFVKVFAASRIHREWERFKLCEEGQVGSAEVLIGLILNQSAFL